MCRKLVLSLVLFSLLVDNISTSANSTVCFFDRAKKLVEQFGELTAQNCSIISDTNSTFEYENGCDIPCDRGFQFGSEKERFELSIGEGRDKSKEIIVLNVTISDIKFRKLSIRHQNLASGNGEVYWQTIEFEEDQIPEKLSVFSAVWESHRTKIQFFAEGREYKFFKEYHFIPNSTLDTDGDNQIFAYVDTTFPNKVYLHVQPPPKHLNITRYIIEFQHATGNQETSYIAPAFNVSVDDLPHQQTSFPNNGYYKFSLVPIDNNGMNYTLIPVAIFCMQSNCETLLIMIVGFAAIPVSIFFFLYICYILCRKRAPKWWRGRKPGCLLVYSATHDAHIDVMIKLAEYLDKWGINAMIDVLDIPNEVHKNPTHWLDSAFLKANTVVVVASPQCKNVVVTKTIYKSLDDHAMKLIHGDRPRSHKKYFAILPPYCTESDLPKEAKTFKLLKIPKDLNILVKKIHYNKYTEVSKTPEERELIKCIELARESIFHGEPIEKPKSLEKLTDLIFLPVNETNIDIDENEEGVLDNTAFIRRESEADGIVYATDIRDVDLLRDGEA